MQEEATCAVAAVATVGFAAHAGAVEAPHREAPEQHKQVVDAHAQEQLIVLWAVCRQIVRPTCMLHTQTLVHIPSHACIARLAVF